MRALLLCATCACGGTPLMPWEIPIAGAPDAEIEEEARREVTSFSVGFDAWPLDVRELRFVEPTQAQPWRVAWLPAARRGEISTSFLAEGLVGWQTLVPYLLCRALDEQTGFHAADDRSFPSSYQSWRFDVSKPREARRELFAELCAEGHTAAAIHADRAAACGQPDLGEAARRLVTEVFDGPRRETLPPRTDAIRMGSIQLADRQELDGVNVLQPTLVGLNLGSERKVLDLVSGNFVAHPGEVTDAIALSERLPAFCLGDGYDCVRPHPSFEMVVLRAPSVHLMGYEMAMLWDAESVRPIDGVCGEQVIAVGSEAGLWLFAEQDRVLTWWLLEG
jgi:hypothetical protein